MTSINRRHILQMAGASVLVPFLPSTAWAQTQTLDLSKVTLRAAFYKGLHNTLLKAAGLDDTPYKIEWKEFNSGGQHIEAINAGSLDFGSGSEIPAVFAAQGHSKARVAAVYREDLNNQGLFVQGKSNIQTVADLKGKRVGYTRGSTSHYYLYKMLKEVGLSLNDIDSRVLSPADGLSAFASGQIDAWAVWGFNGQQARVKYGARTLKTAVGYLSGNFLIYTSVDVIDDPLKHAALADLLLRLQKAYDWSNKNYEKYAQLQSAVTRVPVADILDLFNHRSQDYNLIATSEAAIQSHQNVADTFFELGLLTKAVDVRSLWNKSFDSQLQEGASHLGIKVV